MLRFRGPWVIIQKLYSACFLIDVVDGHAHEIVTSIFFRIILFFNFFLTFFVVIFRFI
jgi:hypothetical protein